MIGTVLTVVSTVWLVATERSDGRYRWIAKPLASIGFMLVPLIEGLQTGTRVPWIVVGLALGLVGDIALLIDSNAAFLFGLTAFLLGHVAYVVAFTRDGFDIGPAAVAAAVMALVAFVALRWMRPHLEPPFTVAVPIYVAVISAMVIAAFGSGSGAPLAVAGAVAFAASDLFVARDRFVLAAPLNATLGLPLYYAGQLLIAWSVAAPTG